MKILVTPTSILREEASQTLEKLKSFADKLVFNPFGRPLTSDEVINMADGCDGYLAGLDYIDAKAIQNIPDSLKVISRYGVGIDRIDMDEAKKRGITITNTPNANTISVAELTIGMMFCAARNISKMDSSMRSGIWERSSGMELSGKNLGLLGFGNIGKTVAQMVQGLQMRVLCYDPYVDEIAFRNYNVTKAEMNDVLEQSDVLSLHLPLNTTTKNIINENTLKLLKPGCILINTARGDLIDNAEALKALDSGRLKALALDVYEQEPPGNHPLYSHTNVLLTPHIGAHTSDAIAKMAGMAVDNLIRELKNAENISRK